MTVAGYNDVIDLRDKELHTKSARLAHGLHALLSSLGKFTPTVESPFAKDRTNPIAIYAVCRCDLFTHF